MWDTATQINGFSTGKNGASDGSDKNHSASVHWPVSDLQRKRRRKNPNFWIAPKCNFLKNRACKHFGHQRHCGNYHQYICHSAKTVHCLIQLHLPEKKCGRKEASEIFRLTITKCCRTSFQSHCFGQTMPSTRATFSAKTGFKDGLWPAAPVTIHSSFPGGSKELGKCGKPWDALQAAMTQL